MVRDLAIRFPDRYGDIPVVDKLTFTVHEGETMGLVGESGCGKSITSLAVMGLLARNAEVTGEILYRGRDLLKLPPKERHALMGPEIAMVYQDALSSLNPSDARRHPAAAADLARRHEDPRRTARTGRPLA